MAVTAPGGVTDERSTAVRPVALGRDFDFCAFWGSTSRFRVPPCHGSQSVSCVQSSVECKDNPKPNWIENTAWRGLPLGRKIYLLTYENTQTHRRRPEARRDLAVQPYTTVSHTLQLSKPNFARNMSGESGAGWRLGTSHRASAGRDMRHHLRALTVLWLRTPNLPVPGLSQKTG